MSVKNIDCPVDDPTYVFGEYANAFRIVSDGGQEILLDFCLYSARQDRAKVVTRVRVSPEFLKVLRDRLRPGASFSIGESVALPDGMS